MVVCWWGRCALETAIATDGETRGTGWPLDHGSWYRLGFRDKGVASTKGKTKDWTMESSDIGSFVAEVSNQEGKSHDISVIIQFLRFRSAGQRL
jgi:hypothetical protein